MINESILKPALSGALSVILPTAEETLLLRACLSSGAAARRAWEEWQSRRNDSGTAFLAENQSVKKLGLLVFDALRRSGLEVDKESQTYLRSAYLKEELRSKIFGRIFREILMMLGNEGIPTLVLKGAALAETVYDNPVLRHCHDIDILIRNQDMSRAATLLSSIGFKQVNPKSAPGSDDCNLEHESGLPLELHTRLFKAVYYNAPLTELWERSQKCFIAGVRARILTPADNLLHVCGHAFYSPSRQSLRWVCDAWFIIERHRDLNWDLLLNCAVRSHLALPLSITLGYLVKELNAPIPSGFLERLSAAASKSKVIERELALLGAHSSTTESFMNLFRNINNWRDRVFLIRWLLFPSPSYLFLVESVRRSWLLPFHYVYRLLRYARVRFRSRFAGPIRRIRWRIDRLFLRINFRIP